MSHEPRPSASPTTRTAPAHERVSIARLEPDTDVRAALAADVVAGLSCPPYSLPPKWLYDAEGSRLFEQITELPEYYPTRTEEAILERVAGQVVDAVRPVEVVELGSGSSRKTRLLLEAAHAAGTGRRYVALDVSEAAIAEAADTLTADYPWLEVEGVVGDFDRHVGDLPRSGRGLVTFLGSTIGNLAPDVQERFVADVGAGMRPGDGFLLGLDLAPGDGKTVADVEAAYDDAAGVTAAFDRNLLTVLERELGAELDAEAFVHDARWEPEHSWVASRLLARRPTTIRVPDLALVVDLAEGEGILTETSYKFSRARAERLLTAAGLVVERIDTDDRGRFALVLARR